MVIWEILDDDCDPIVWDELLLCAADYNVFQSHGWGEYKRSSGSQPVRCIARNREKKVIAAVQILFKSFPLGIKIGWAPGGPCVRFSQSESEEFDELLKSLFRHIQQSLGKRIFLRFNSCAPGDHKQSYIFSKACVRPFFKLNSGFSILLDIALGHEKFMDGMTSKHRYYTKKAMSHNLQWKIDNDIEALLSIHNEMTDNKKLASLRISREDISNMRRCLNENSFIFAGYSGEDAVVSCLVLTFGKRAFYMTAATGEKGRGTNASYAMLSKLTQYLRESGIEKLDFGGIDPRSPSAAGVNHFKCGFGGKVVEYLGEWEWASSEPLRWMVNLAIRYRGGRL